MSVGMIDRRTESELVRVLSSWGMARRDAEDTVRWCSLGPGLVQMSATDPQMRPGLGIVVDEHEDDGLARLFALRECLVDEEFLAVWEVSMDRAMRVVLDTIGSQAICRYTVTIERPEPVERRFLFFVHKLAPLLVGLQQPGTHLWLVPSSVAAVRTLQPAAAYEVFSRCLPIGEVKKPSAALARALAHVGFRSG